MLNMIKMSTFWKGGNIWYFESGMTVKQIISRFGDQINLKPRSILSKKKATLQTPFNISRVYCKLNMTKMSTFWKWENNWYFESGMTVKKSFQDLGTRSIINPGLQWVRKQQHFSSRSIFAGFISCWICLKFRLSEKGEFVGILKVEWL